ncbi:MAG: TIGR04283 family arsenosugar biosynthesis glycosyltransferase [Gammaproteobacteria bacterium]
MSKPLISVVVPVLNEAQNIKKTLAVWQSRRGQQLELIVVDGGSFDHTVSSAALLADKVISSVPGRARQMNAGAKAASGTHFVFLHADTIMSEQAWQRLLELLNRRRSVWGFFRARLDNPMLIFRIIASCMNWRARLTAVATGDQCIFVSRDLFEKIEGYADIPLMEDVEICKRLRKLSKPVVVKKRVSTSTRRWESHGIVATVLTMWRLRLAYFVGVSPDKLHRLYYKR